MTDAALLGDTDPVVEILDTLTLLASESIDTRLFDLDISHPSVTQDQAVEFCHAITSSEMPTAMISVAPRYVAPCFEIMRHHHTKLGTVLRHHLLHQHENPYDIRLWQSWIHDMINAGAQEIMLPPPGEPETMALALTGKQHHMNEITTIMAMLLGALRDILGSEHDLCLNLGTEEMDQDALKNWIDIGNALAVSFVALPVLDHEHHLNIGPMVQACLEEDKHALADKVNPTKHQHQRLGLKIPISLETVLQDTRTSLQEIKKTLGEEWITPFHLRFILTPNI